MFLIIDKYQFGHNGQEKDNNYFGRGTHYYAPNWTYDSRTGRRWNLDPIKKEMLSEYSTFSNSPIWRIDPDGDDDFFNSKGRLIWRGKIDRNDNQIQIIEVSDKEFIEALSVAKRKFNGNIQRMTYFMRAYSHDIASTPLANRDGSITADGKTVANIAAYYKSELGLNRYLTYQYAYLEDANAQTSGPPYYTEFSLNRENRRLAEEDLKYVGNLQSLITHEYNHVWDDNAPAYGSNWHLYHLYQYKSQLESPSWNNTTDGYRFEFIKKVGKFLSAPGGTKSERTNFKKYFEKKLDVKYLDRGTFKIGSQTYRRDGKD